MTQFHRYALASHVYVGSAAANGRVDLISGVLFARGMHADKVHQAALALVDRQITGQAATLAFNNAHIAIGLLFCLSLPLLLLMKRASGGADLGVH
jgi:DHA2 family multidrug resistance protein